MKRLFILTIFAGILTTLIVAQPRLTSNKETHNFGQIEWKVPVSVDFTITNSGNEPLVLTNVTASCACAVVDWTKTPIQPGETGTVTATFDAKALGHFHKSVGIYSNASPELVYLHFTGDVVREVTEYSHTLPYAIGDIQLDKTELDFPDVHRGDKPHIILNVVNQSSTPYEPVLMHLPSYLTMDVQPKILLRGQRGIIRLTLDTDRLSDLGLTQASVYLSRFTGDKVSEENEIPFSVVLLPDFTHLSSAQRLNAPEINVSEDDIDFSDKFGRKDKVRYDVTVTNTGKSPLEISKLQVFNPAVGVDLKKSTLQSGEKTRLRITLDRKGISKKKQLRILLISNDPDNPKTVINLRYMLFDSTNRK